MLEQVNIIGDKYVHVFYSADNLLEIECTKEEYEALGLPNAGQPTPPKGYTWASSHIRKKFDTLSGDLEDGQYADYDSEQGVAVDKKMVKLPGYLLYQCSKDKVIDGEVAPEIIASIEKRIEPDWIRDKKMVPLEESVITTK